MTLRALVVEDEEIAGEANAAYLGRVGIEVVGVARSAQAALRLLAGSEHIDLVLLDMHLPDGHGLALLRRIRAAGHPADVIAVTSARDIDVVRQAVAQGVVSYLIKPFTFASFRAKIEQYRTYRDQLDAQPGSLGQHDVDAMLASLRPSRDAAALPKGLTASTLDQVSTVVRAQGPLSAAELGALINISRVTARRYLEHLAEAGTVQRELRHGGAGRPEVEYGWR